MSISAGRVQGTTLLAAALVTLVSVTMLSLRATEPQTPSVAWAYPVEPPTPENRPSNEGDLRWSLPGSDATFRPAEVRNPFAIADWRPQDHPAMPPIVANGRRPDVLACGYCHLPSGNGRPENAAIAGLPRNYIVAQMRAFRSGERHSSVPGRAPTALMNRLSRTLTDAEIDAAAAYFSLNPFRRYARVVEAAQVPKTRTTAWLYSRDPAGGSERIGNRIIEVPDDFDRFERRDPTMRYIAYVPPGSIRRGRALAGTWQGGRFACSTCHGADLRGAGDVPALAGRSPTYIVRQLNDLRTGARGGDGAVAMTPVVARMTGADMVALAAFLGSIAP